MARMQIGARLFAAAVALGVFGANAAPVYIPTTLSREETCTRAVQWDAPKVTLDPELLVIPGSAAPIVWQNFESERQQFGYNPAFSPQSVSIAPNGRPIIRDKDLTLWILNDDGTWKTVPLLSVAQQSLQQQGYTWTTTPPYPLFASAPEQDRRVVFDQHCNAYMVVNAYNSSLGFAFLLHSRDGGESWSAYPLPYWTGVGDVRMEAPSSPKHRLQRPPVIILHANPDGNGTARDTVLVLTKKLTNGNLDLGTRKTITDTVCCASHSGNDTQVISDGDLVHFGYPHAPALVDPVTGRKGTRQEIVTYRRSTGLQVSGPTVLGFGFDGPTGDAANANAHSQPALALDSAGFLHVVISGHDSQMWYRKATTPHVSTGWGTPEYVSQGAHYYTYPSLILDALDQPHVISRSGESAIVFKLVHRMRNAATAAWSTEKVLLDPGRTHKVEWYNKATIDPAGRLFVSYSYSPSLLLAAEATQFSSVWGVTLTKVVSSCVGNRCVYVGPDNQIPAVSPGVLVSWDNGTVFRLLTTPRFLQNPPAIEPYRELYPFITRILSGN
jgi:hypothetical protein